MHDPFARLCLVFAANLLEDFKNCGHNEVSIFTRRTSFILKINSFNPKGLVRAVERTDAQMRNFSLLA